MDGHSSSNEDAAFWRSKTAAERVAAVEFLRRQCYLTTNRTEMPRLVKVLRLIEKGA
jgi:anti-sigma-K factor RskA